MISDVCSDARASIQEYLDHPATAGCYTDLEVRREIDILLAQLEKVRVILDTPPDLAKADEERAVDARD